MIFDVAKVTCPIPENLLEIMDGHNHLQQVFVLALDGSQLRLI